MKKILIVLACLLLCACSNILNNRSEFDEIFVEDIVSENRANNYTEYIEFYVPSDLSEESCDTLSYVFNIDDCKVIMNVNVAAIINGKDFKIYALNNDGFFDEDKLIYSHEGKYTNINKEKLSYFFKAYEYDDNCLLYFVSNEVTIYGNCPKEKKILLADKIVQLAAGSNVNNSRVINDYSSKDVIDFNKKTVNLFENVFPVEGRVEEMMTDSTGEVPEE